MSGERKSETTQPCSVCGKPSIMQCRADPFGKVEGWEWRCAEHNPWMKPDAVVTQQTAPRTTPDYIAGMRAAEAICVARMQAHKDEYKKWPRYDDESRSACLSDALEAQECAIAIKLAREALQHAK